MFRENWKPIAVYFLITLIIGVLTLIYWKQEFKSVSVENANHETEIDLAPRYPSFEEQCQILMVEAQEKSPDVTDFRYDPLTASCYIRYLRPEFWSGQNCLALLPSEAVKSKDVANAMRHNSKLCQEGILELNVREF